MAKSAGKDVRSQGDRPPAKSGAQQKRAATQDELKTKAQPAADDQPTARIHEVTITIPVCDMPKSDTRIRHHLDVGNMSYEQGRAAFSFFMAAIKSDLYLANGRPVDSQALAMRWLLEQVARQLPETAPSFND